MKHLTAILLSATLLTLFAAACNKDDNPQLPSKSYTLYNYSSGSAVTAGSFTVKQLSDSSASLSVTLGSGFLVSGVTLKSYLIMKDSATGTELIYANLNDIDGASGQATTSPVVNSSTNTAIKYTDLISAGYSVKILNNTNVQATGEISN